MQSHIYNTYFTFEISKGRYRPNRLGTDCSGISVEWKLERRNSFLIFQHIGYEHMTGPYIIPIANGDLATDHVSYPPIKMLNQNWIWFNLIWVLISCSSCISAPRFCVMDKKFWTRILEVVASNDANIIYGNYIWDIRILDSWISFALEKLDCGNVFH